MINDPYRTITTNLGEIIVAMFLCTMENWRSILFDNPSSDGTLTWACFFFCISSRAGHLMAYLPLKLENSWYPVLFDSTDRNELASGVGRCKRFLAQSFFCPPLCFTRCSPPVTSLAVFLVISLVLLPMCTRPFSFYSLSLTVFFESSGENRRLSTSYREIPVMELTAFLTIIDFRNDFGILHKSLA